MVVALDSKRVAMGEPFDFRLKPSEESLQGRKLVSLKIRVSVGHTLRFNA